MRRTLKLLSATLASFLIALPAFAVPAPMPEAEMMEKSDLVALVRVLSVTCTGVTKDPQTGADLCSYLANLQVREVKKGDAKKGDEVIVTWRAVPEGTLDTWAVAYYPGEEVWTHLTKRSGGASYATTSLNAKGEPVKPAESRDLPTGMGETFVAPPEPQKQTPL
jgi:hypothetical protein